METPYTLLSKKKKNGVSDKTHVNLKGVYDKNTKTLRKSHIIMIYIHV